MSDLSSSIRSIITSVFSTKHRQAIIVGGAFGVFLGLFRWLIRDGAGDLGSGLCLARAILAGAHHTYDSCPKVYNLPQDTIFAGLFMLPFVTVPDSITGAVWTGTTGGMLAWALTRKQEYWRLLLFLTPAYWMTFWYAQAGALLCLIALFPNLLPLAFYKPPQGLVIGLWRFSWFRMYISTLVFMLSLIIWPTWFVEWIQQAGGYQFIIPLFVLPVGPLLLFAVPRWRDDRARLLLLMSCIPQRGVYNALLLYLLPTTLREMSFVVICAWIGLFIWIQGDSEAIGLVVGCYIPTLLMIQPYFHQLWSIIKVKRPYSDDQKP